MQNIEAAWVIWFSNYFIFYLDDCIIFSPWRKLESSIFSKGGRQIDFDLFKIHAIL